MYFYKNKLSILSLSNECFYNYMTLLHLNQNFSGEDPQTPFEGFIVSKTAMVTRGFLIHKSPPPPPPHTHTYRTSKKSRTRRKYKEWKHLAPKHTSCTPFGIFFFCFSMVRPLLLKISGSAYDIPYLLWCSCKGSIVGYIMPPKPFF